MTPPPHKTAAGPRAEAAPSSATVADVAGNGEDVDASSAVSKADRLAKADTRASTNTSTNRLPRP